jgi:hypothetical protein
MTDTYKATPECWEWQEKWASKEVPDEDSSCFLELRARVEALEAQRSNYPAIPDSSTPPPMATDEELLEIWNSERPSRGWVARRAIYDVGVAYGQASAARRAARRAAPPRLKEQAIAELEKVDYLWDRTEFGQGTLDSLDTIRRALEALPND